MNIIKSNWRLIAVALVIIGAFLFYYEVLPSYNQGQKDIGQKELLSDILNNNAIPQSFTYCPDINFKKVEEELRNSVNETLNNTDEEIKESINNIVDPIKELCKEGNLYVQFQTGQNYCQAEFQRGYEQALTEVQQNFNCQRK